MDKVVELKKGALDGNYDNGKGKKFADEANVAEAFLEGGGGSKKKKAAKTGKTFKDDGEADASAEVFGGKKSGDEDTGPKEEEKENNGYFNENGEWIEG